MVPVVAAREQARASAALLLLQARRAAPAATPRQLSLGGVDVGLGEWVALVVVEGADDEHRQPVDPGEDRRCCLEQLGVTLLPHEAPDCSTHDLVVADAELGPDRSPFVGSGRPEPLEVDAVAQPA